MEEGHVRIQAREAMPRTRTDKRPFLQCGGGVQAPLRDGEDSVQDPDYLNLLSFKLSYPGNALKKAEALLRMMISAKEKLRFRDVFPMDSRL